MSTSAPEELVAGDEADIVKLRPDGSEAARYTGTVLPSPAGWIVAEAIWGFRRMELGYLTFAPGDRLIEFFATEAPFNAFAIFSDKHAFKGWYCNVTYPTTVVDQTIYWHDLYIDVVQQPNGHVLVLDEDELEEAGLSDSDPETFEMIIGARDMLTGMIRDRSYPFSEVARPQFG